MRYASPLFEGKEQYVPIVTKNRDTLVGFLQGINDYYDSMEIIMEELNVSELLFPPGLTEMYDLSSRKFNDLMPDGRYESLLTKQEKKKLLTEIFDEVEGAEETEEDDIEYDDVLKAACPCGMGFYSWKDYKDIPQETTKCDICGRCIIHYTGVDDWTIDYEDGKDI